MVSAVGINNIANEETALVSFQIAVTWMEKRDMRVISLVLAMYLQKSFVSDRDTALMCSSRILENDLPEIEHVVSGTNQQPHSTGFLQLRSRCLDDGRYQGEESDAATRWEAATDPAVRRGVERETGTRWSTAATSVLFRPGCL